MFSNASSTGYGGYLVELGPELAHGQWSADEVVLSSIWRELKAVYEVLRSFASKLEGHAVKWFSDNQAVASADCASWQWQAPLARGCLVYFRTLFSARHQAGDGVGAQKCK